jgi:hypothetical protein
MNEPLVWGILFFVLFFASFVWVDSLSDEKDLRR